MKRMEGIKRISALLLAVVLLIASAGCSTAQAKTIDLTEDVTAGQVDVSGALSEDALRSVSAFAVELFQRAAAGEGKNTLVSPLSICLALGMVANGAENETRAEFEQVLGRYGLDIDALNRVYKALSEESTAVSGSTIQNIANSVWYNTGFAADPDFLQTNADYFDAAAYVADFSDSQTIEDINKWVADNTEGLIAKMIDGLDPQAVMLLLNTVYFKATWLNQFHVNDNYDDLFYLADGSTVTTTFMSNGLQQETYLSLDGARGVLLPYDDGKFAYMAVLPPEGMTAEEYVASWAESTVSDLLASGKMTAVRLDIPKYTARFELTLNDILLDMGLTSAFDPETADFSKVGSSEENIFISRVLHKTYIKVNEMGTEAAAATGVELSTSAMPPEDYETVCLDHPFVYAIVDLDTQLPIFLGVFDAPTE